MKTKVRKRSKLPRQKASKTPKRGLPLRFIQQTEKLTTSVSCKIYPSLAKWIKKHGGSTFLRSLIEQAKLKEERLSELEEFIEHS